MELNKKEIVKVLQKKRSKWKNCRRHGGIIIPFQELDRTKF
jgi:hypothetical protein